MNLHKIDARLTEDFRYYTEKAPLVLKPKSGPLVQLEFNNAQNILHEALEKQKARTGKVRAIVLKGRQQGISTYIGARFYHKTSRNQANNTFIITHLADATSNLFAMTMRYHQNVDDRLRTPTVSETNKGIVFDGLDSNFRVATAGSAEVGRSYTITNFHGSEYAFWRDPEKISAGALQAVPNLPGTEIIFESTANGMTNDFYTMCMDALKGKGEFELVFIPWFVQDEYRLDYPSDFELTEEEDKVQQKYKLDLRQMWWRRRKIEDDFKGKTAKFMQEYPCNPREAFQAAGDTLMDVQDVLDARTRQVHDFNAPVVMGVDPASRKDRAVIAVRQGDQLKTCITFDCEEEPLEPMELVQEIITAIDEHKPDKVFIDSGEIGHGIVSRLKELGQTHLVTGVNFGQRASNSDLYENKRAEMWIKMRDWIHEGRCKIPDSDEVMADLMAMPDYFLNTKQRQQLISKEKLKKDFKISTDIGDAIGLTFAFPVKPRQAAGVKRKGVMARPVEEKRQVKRKKVKF